jgi:hypothetical protein
MGFLRYFLRKLLFVNRLEGFDEMIFEGFGFLGSFNELNYFFILNTNVMKNTVSLIGIFILGITLGVVGSNYFFKPKQENPFLIGDVSKLIRPSKSVSYDEAKAKIDSFYVKAERNPKWLLSTFATSYAFDFKDFYKLADSIIAKYPKQSKEGANLRFYPSVWTDEEEDGKERFSFIIAAQFKDSTMAFDSNTKDTDGLLYEYIAPCPKHCPTEKSDFYCDGEWDKKLQLIGGKKFERQKK